MVPNSSTAQRSIRYRGSLSLALGSLLFLLSAHGHGQQQDSISYILFDPVPLRITAAEPADTDTTDSDPPQTAITELRSLPDSDPVYLREWMESRRSAAENRLEQNQLDIEAYEKSIGDLELREGPFSSALPQQLMSLADSLQSNGELQTALEYLQQATHITRINHGLFSTEQIPIIQRTIENLLQQGDLAAADELQQYLFYVQQKNLGHDTAELLPALEDYAEWNMFAFSARPGRWLAFVDDDDDSDDSVDPPAVNPPIEIGFRVERLINAQQIYWAIIQILQQNFGADDPRILDAEMRLALTNYFYATTIATDSEAFAAANYVNAPGVTMSHASPPSITNMGYRHGRDALQRRIDYLASDADADPLQRVRAEIDLADWMLFFNRQRLDALESYAASYASLAPTMPEAELNALFSPDYPTLLPTFITPAHTRQSFGMPEDLALNYQGHVDMEFELNRYGKTTRVNILGSSEGTPEAVEELLETRLRRSQFRPRLGPDHQTLMRDTLQVRYYYAF